MYWLILRSATMRLRINTVFESNAKWWHSSQQKGSVMIAPTTFDFTMLDRSPWVSLKALKMSLSIQTWKALISHFGLLEYALRREAFQTPLKLVFWGLVIQGLCWHFLGASWGLARGSRIGVISPIYLGCDNGIFILVDLDLNLAVKSLLIIGLWDANLIKVSNVYKI